MQNGAEGARSAQVEHATNRQESENERSPVFRRYCTPTVSKRVELKSAAPSKSFKGRRGTDQLPPVRLPRRDRVLRAHRQMNRVDHHRVPRPSSRVIRLSRRRTRHVPSVEQALVVGRVVLLLESCRETEVRELDVASGVDEDVVGFDVSARMNKRRSESRVRVGKGNATRRGRTGG